MAKQGVLNDEQMELVRRAVRELCDRLGKQQAVGELVGLSQQTISSILNGRPIGLEAATKIAKHVAWLDVASVMRGMTPEEEMDREREEAIRALIRRPYYDPDDVRAAADEISSEEAAGQDKFWWFEQIEALLRRRLQAKVPERLRRRVDETGKTVRYTDRKGQEFGYVDAERRSPPKEEVPTATSSRRRRRK